MSQMSEGGEGSTLIGTLSQIFSFFFSDASPKKVLRALMEIGNGVFSVYKVIPEVSRDFQANFKGVSRGCQG